MVVFVCPEEKPVGFRLKPPTLIHGQAPSSGESFPGRRRVCSDGFYQEECVDVMAVRLAVLQNKLRC